MTVKPDYSSSLAFLALLYPDGPWTVTAIHPFDRSPGGDAEIHTRTYDDPAYVRSFLQDHAGWNLYYNVNPTVEPVSKKPECHEISSVHYLHVDMDRLEGEQAADAWGRITGLIESRPGGLELPTVGVYSGGGGGNFLWALEEPLPVLGENQEEREASAEAVKLYSKQIELILSGADNCHNVDRILRLPGTLNWPNQKKIEKYGRTDPVLAELRFWDTTRRYPIRSFACAPAKISRDRSDSGNSRHHFSAPSNVERLVDVSSLGDTVSPEVKECIRTGLPPQRYAQEWGSNRSDMVFWVVCELVRCSVPDDKIYSIITDPSLPVSAHVLDQRSGVVRYATRQIERAHDFAVHRDLARINARYAVIENVGGRCMVIEEEEDGSISYTAPDSFKTYYCNEFVPVGTKKNKGGEETEQLAELGTWWFRHRFRRQFKRIEFQPDPARARRNCYNLFRGLAYPPRPGEWGLFHDHLRDNICRGVLPHLDYLLGWMAYQVQFPARPGYTAVVMRGIQGTGKGTVAEIYGALFGPHYMPMADGEHLVGRFTGHLRNKLLLFADEAFFAGDNRNVSKLKALITEPTLNIEDKGIRIEHAPNYLKFLIASNREWVISAEASDRRFFVVETLENPTSMKTLYHQIKAEMQRGGYEGFLYDLLKRDLSKFDIREIPQTDALVEQKELSMSAEATWWHNKLWNGELAPGHQGWEVPIVANTLTEDYYLHCQRVRVVRPMGAAQFGKFISRAVPAYQARELRVQRRQDGVPRNMYQFPPLRECREHWNTEWKAPFKWPQVRSEQEHPQQRLVAPVEF